ncbi:MAG TPA: RNA polymerase sigma factor [Pyrinomonadaceae bacterium]|nr:RNA polymerase sigma factor [Pyrinomonadaceae bacterium]
MKPENQPSDTELVQSMLAGDEQALAALYQRLQQNIYRFAFQMSGSASVAEDVTQDVFMLLIREGQSFDPERGSLRSFLLGVARNYVLRRLRRERFYVAMEEDVGDAVTDRAESSAAGPLDELSRTETIVSVRKAVLLLPEKYREALVLCDLEELSYAEAAEVLGCAVGTVRSRLHRGRGLLLEKLKPAREDETVAAPTKSARCFA